MWFHERGRNIFSRMTFKARGPRTELECLFVALGIRAPVTRSPLFHISTENTIQFTNSVITYQFHKAHAVNIFVVHFCVYVKWHNLNSCIISETRKYFYKSFILFKYFKPTCVSQFMLVVYFNIIYFQSVHIHERHAAQTLQAISCLKCSQRPQQSSSVVNAAYWFISGAMRGKVLKSKCWNLSHPCHECHRRTLLQPLAVTAQTIGPPGAKPYFWEIGHLHRATTSKEL